MNETERPCCDRCSGDLAKVGFVEGDKRRLIYTCVACRIELKDCIDCQRPRSRWGNNFLCIECYVYSSWYA